MSFKNRSINREKEEGALTIAIDDGVTNKKLAELFKRLDDKFLQLRSMF